MAALGDYANSVELGLGVCFRQNTARESDQVPTQVLASGASVAKPSHRSTADGVIRAIVFGSDQGLVGRFNVTLHRLRQAQIDEELSDVISGFKALSDADG